jgi:hypothetical protein
METIKGALLIVTLAGQMPVVHAVPFSTMTNCEKARAQLVQEYDKKDPRPYHMLWYVCCDEMRAIIVRALSGRRRVAEGQRATIDTSTAAGNCFLDMLGVFAEFETNLRRERQLEGNRQGEGSRCL